MLSTRTHASLLYQTRTLRIAFVEMVEKTVLAVVINAEKRKSRVLGISCSSKAKEKTRRKDTRNDRGRPGFVTAVGGGGGKCVDFEMDGRKGRGVRGAPSRARRTGFASRSAPATKPKSASLVKRLMAFLRLTIRFLTDLPCVHTALCLIFL